MALFTPQGRYWRTLLPTLISHIELYPGYQVRLHVSADAMVHPCSPIITSLKELLPDRFDYVLHEEPYVNCEPTLWRLLPLWDDSVDVFFCRDVDSVPSTEELKAIRLFLDGGAAIHSIRSFHLHVTLLMAGLCGFKPKLLGMVREMMPTFELFKDAYITNTRDRKNYEWGCDQEALMMLFMGLRHMMMDCPVGNCPAHRVDLGIPTGSRIAMNTISILDLNQDLLAICDEITAIPWGDFKGFAGRPQGDFRRYLPRMLELDLPACNAAKTILDQNLFIKEFYEPDYKLPEDEEKK